MPVIARAEPEAPHAAALSRLIAARQAFEWDRPAEPRRDVGKQFSSAYLLKLSMLLPLDQISVILAAEEIREQALALVRRGNMVQAAEGFRRSAALCDEAPLSDHARNAAHSFQSAATAYLAYRQGRHDDAIRDLEDAILACDSLGEDDDGAMEFRRIHLARNILRAQCHCRPAARVVADSVDLLRYIGGDAARWPLEIGRGTGKPRRLTADQRAWEIDETIINLALAELDVGAGDGLVPGAADRYGFDVAVLASFEWCEAMIASRTGERRAFLHHAANFFDYRPYDLVHAAKHLDMVFRDGNFDR